MAELFSYFKEAIRKPTIRLGDRIRIAVGTELNHGVHEDSDHLTLTRDVQAVVVGLERNGAILVKLINPDNGKPIEPPVYYHQPAR